PHCGCRNAFGDEPNTNICPVCLGLPGSLPVLNEQAVELAMRIGLALHCSVEDSIFHRKNYFYPDMPKDYQISQYDKPINSNGWMELADGTRIGVERAHLEEDTGKSTHVGGRGRIHEADYSLVDYNRAGVPLVEIVSAPDLRSAAQARDYVFELRSILVATGASDGRMEEGSLRVDANVSVRSPPPQGERSYGIRCEVKNLNSLRSLGRAIDYEARRQIEVLSEGGVVSQETRHWDEESACTVSMRSKEEAYDYRYFPEPDLVPLAPDEGWKSSVASSLPPMPAERRASLMGLLGESAADLGAQVATVVAQDLDGLAVGALQAGADARLVLQRVANEAATDAAAARMLDPLKLAKLVDMEHSGKLSATQAKSVLATMLATGGDPAEIAAAKGYEAMAGDALAESVQSVIEANPDGWHRYCSGEEQVAQFLVGQVMKATRGRADGKAVVAELRRRRSQ
ncbi:MAG: Asp-tRNA(Asn)/Glu-tRNA(Gln) amidotransferase subunit GatB, partial [Actinobacteria bacterium]|nr:Asp-tRNA(Asn)/Glu-tRNA(Gln) amidotransferase subunit GatB [Actinomycetota bacterium]